MENITVKFGGSSLADSTQFRKVAAIVKENPLRRYVVVSAPGRRFREDTKVTDLLYRAHAAVGTDEFDGLMDEIAERFTSIASELGICVELGLDEIRKEMEAGAGADYCASRGEYLSAKLMAGLLDRPFLDAKDYIFFREDGSLDAQHTQAALSGALRELPGAVIPGFYGANPDGSVRTFSRGGSDITGALVAQASRAVCYENWTDVSGILETDPRIVPQARPIQALTYGELRELAYMGASVLHEDAIFPVRSAGIPLRIRNTNDPAAPGTDILKEASQVPAPPVTGLAGKRDFSIVHIEKGQMNETPGFVYHVLEPFCRRGISIEHLPTGIDTISVVVPTEQLRAHRAEVLYELRESINPDTVMVENDLALIAVVGRGMIGRKGIAASLFRALADAGVNIRMIDQGSGEMNIIVGVDAQDYETAIRALYGALFQSGAERK